MKKKVKAKGKAPNPLSVKKKKTSTARPMLSKSITKEGEGKEISASQKKRLKKRAKKATTAIAA